MRITSWWCAVATAAVIAVGALFAQGAPANAVAEITKLSDERYAANRKGDRAFYERLLMPNFAFLQPTGTIWTKKQYLDDEFPTNITAPRATVVRSNFRVLVDGESAVASYEDEETVPVGAQKVENNLKRVDTYVRLNGEWKLLSMAAILLPPWPATVRVDPKTYGEYEGTYGATTEIQVVVTREGDRLFLQPVGLEKVELFPESESVFYNKTDSRTARNVFERDSRGRVVALVWRRDGQSVRADKVK